MAMDPVTALFEIGGKVIDRIWPDPTKAAEAKLELFKLQQSGELAQIAGQLEINKIEAASASTFVSGWRPAVGWIGAVSLGCVYIPKAIVMTAIWTYQAIVIVSAWNGVGVPPALPVYPDLGLADILGLLGSLLGFGVLRTKEKLSDVARS